VMGLTPVYKEELVTTVPFTTWAPCCLNFLVGLCATLPLATAFSVAFSHPDTVAGSPPGFLTCKCSLFSALQSSSFSNYRPPIKMTLIIVFWDIGVTQWIAFPILACQRKESHQTTPMDLRLVRTVSLSCGWD
jgi:hypothetical protein